MIFLIGYILLCLTIFWLVQKKKYNVALWVIILLGVSCRIQVSLDKNLHAWDERYHALVAKNLVDNPIRPVLYKHPIKAYDYKDWSKNHIWLHKLPVPLWLMSSSIYLFGNSAFACRIPSIILSTLSIYILYLVAFRLFGNKKIALFSSFLLSINGLVLELAGGRVATDHIDIAFFSFVLLSIYFSLRCIDKARLIHLVLVALFLSLAILSKWLPALIVLPIFWLYGVKQKVPKARLLQYVFSILALAVCFVSPWIIYIQNSFPEIFHYEMQYNRRHLFESLTEHETNWTFYIHFIRINYGELVYLPIVFAVYHFFKTRKYELLMLLVWMLVPLCFFSLAQTRMQGYILFTAPAIFLVTAYFMDHVLHLNSRRYLWQFLAALMIVLPIRYSIERIKPFEKQEPFILDRYDIDGSSNYEQTIFLNCTDPIQLMYFTNCFVAYEDDLKSEEKIRLEEEGFTLIDLKQRD